jgi:hypothetical protein
MSRQRFRWLPLDRRAGGGGLPCSGDLGRPCRHRPPGRSSTAEQRSRADGRRRRRRSLPQRRRLPSVVERGWCSAATGEAEGPRRSRKDHDAREFGIVKRGRCNASACEAEGPTTELLAAAFPASRRHAGGRGRDRATRRGAPRCDVDPPRRSRGDPRRSRGGRGGGPEELTWRRFNSADADSSSTDTDSSFSCLATTELRSLSCAGCRSSTPLSSHASVFCVGCGVMASIVSVRDETHRNTDRQSSPPRPPLPSRSDGVFAFEERGDAILHPLSLA